MVVNLGAISFKSDSLVACWAGRDIPARRGELRMHERLRLSAAERPSVCTPGTVYLDGVQVPGPWTYPHLSRIRTPSVLGNGRQHGRACHCWRKACPLGWPLTRRSQHFFAPVQGPGWLAGGHGSIGHGLSLFPPCARTGSGQVPEVHSYTADSAQRV